MIFGEHIRDAIRIIKNMTRKNFERPCITMPGFACEGGWAQLDSNGTSKTCCDRPEDCAYYPREEK